MVKMLLGALEVNRTDEEWRTPLIGASACASAEVVKPLLAVLGIHVFQRDK